MQLVIHLSTVRLTFKLEWCNFSRVVLILLQVTVTGPYIAKDRKPDKAWFSEYRFVAKHLVKTLKPNPIFLDKTVNYSLYDLI